MLEHHRGGGRLIAFGRAGAHTDAVKFGDRHADVHADAAHRAAQHHAIAVEFDCPALSVGAAVARGIRTGRAKGSSRNARLDPTGPPTLI
jgi:hypothetical protein